ncbi:MAG: hypothetical protein WC900_03500 [Oscillospiraceae bacterium]|jgi:hypothetical protein
MEVSQISSPFAIMTALMVLLDNGYINLATYEHIIKNEFSGKAAA